ncbi:S8 family serine peptidase [Oleiharenicola lentus]|nr:S8 family serine peptidase [Oleiharenicola lentus]
MISRTLNRLMIVTAALLAVSQVHARSYVVVGNAGKLPAKLEAAVAAAGGTITRHLPQIGVAIVESSSPQFVANVGKLAGLDAVLPDAQWKPSQPAVIDGLALEDAVALPANHTTLVTDAWAALQWGLEAVDAGTAWQAGQTGAGVRVAVLDSGVASAHLDIAPNLNTALCTSFVPGEAYNFTGTGFNHGTHVAGIIAAAANGVGTVGVAPKAEIVSVKVLSAVSGSGSFGGIISGIVYAADIGADVINMSLGAEFPRSGYIDDNGTPADPSDDYKVGANELTALINATSRATTYAYQKGVTTIVSAGNSAIDRDHDGSYFVLPADCTHVVSVSATGPTGWALNQAGTDLDVLASYSNYGQSRIDLAAPGGDFMYPGNDISVVGGIAQYTWVFDMVFAPSNRIGTSNRYSWSAGTSMAAPHVSAVAAIIIGRNGGSMKPAAVVAALRASADDLGKPGNDDAYGAGRVNAGRAATE